MYFTILGSGSKGNSIYIESGDTSILIDAGLSGKAISSRLNSHKKDISNIDGIFLTHDHGDHINGAGIISRRCSLPVYANVGTFLGADRKMGKTYRYSEFETGTLTTLKDLEIRPFSISHDTADPVGFIVSDGKKKVALCTDTGKASVLMASRLTGCDAVILEFNHDPVLLKTGPYPDFLKQRVLSSQGHLSNGDAAELLGKIKHDNLKYVVLAHLSGVNNTADHALESACNVIDKSIVRVASQDVATELFYL